MKHEIDKRFAPGEEQKGPGALIGTCHVCRKKGVWRDGECEGAPLSVDKVGAYDPRSGEAVLVDELVFAMHEPPPLIYPPIESTITEARAIAGNWSATAPDGETILADLAKMAEVIKQCAPPPPGVRPWCCEAALVPGAKYIQLEWQALPFFVCEKHLAEIKAHFARRGELCAACGLHPAEPNLNGLCSACDVEEAES